MSAIKPRKLIHPRKYNIQSRRSISALMIRPEIEIDSNHLSLPSLQIKKDSPTRLKLGASSKLMSHSSCIVLSNLDELAPLTLKQTKTHRKGNIRDVSSSSDILGTLSNKETQIIRIKCNSNWGNSSILSISNISFFDDNKHRIPIDSFFITPRNVCLSKSTNIEKLFEAAPNHDEPLWSIPFPLANDKQLTINCAISSLYSISSIRIWNPEKEPEAGLKNFEVFINEEFIFSDEVPKQFVIDRKISQSKVVTSFNKDSLLLEMFPEKKDNLTDKYGIYPLVSTSRLDFQILSTYEKGDNIFGLNGIEIFDHSGHLIENDEILDISIKGCSYCSNMSTILRSDKKSNSPDDMLIGQTKWDPLPTLSILFKKPIKISKLTIWNYNGRGRNFHCGVKFIIITHDYGKLWSGKIKEATGNMAGMMNSITNIQFTDVPFYSQTIFD